MSCTSLVIGDDCDCQAGERLELQVAFTDGNDAAIPIASASVYAASQQSLIDDATVTVDAAAGIATVVWSGTATAKLAAGLANWFRVRAVFAANPDHDDVTPPIWIKIS